MYRDRLMYQWVFAGDCPESPLVVPARVLSGRLLQHAVCCEACGGEGFFDPGDPELCHDCTEREECTQKKCMPCDECNNEGKLYWPSWYASETNHCLYCSRQVLVDFRVFGDEAWAPICLPCYLALHKEECGCDLWLDAERQIMGILVETLRNSV